MPIRNKGSEDVCSTEWDGRPGAGPKYQGSTRSSQTAEKQKLDMGEVLIPPLFPPHDSNVHKKANNRVRQSDTDIFCQKTNENRFETTP